MESDEVREVAARSSMVNVKGKGKGDAKFAPNANISPCGYKCHPSPLLKQKDSILLSRPLVVIKL